MDLPQYLGLVWLEVEPIEPQRVNLAKPLQVSGPDDDYSYFASTLTVSKQCPLTRRGLADLRRKV
jgi:hypothetical protein